MENLEDKTNDLEKIRKLGEIATKKEEYFIGMSKGEPYCPGGGSGHSSKDALEYRETPMYGQRYVYSKKERKNALKTLRKYKKKGLNNEIKKEIDSVFRKRMVEIKDKAILVVASVTLAGLVGLMATGIGIGIKGCVSKELERRERQAKIIPDYSSSMKFLEDQKLSSQRKIYQMELIHKMELANKNSYEKKFYETEIKIYKRKIKEINEKMDRFEKKIKEKVERGYLTPEHKSWRTYKNTYEHKDWWPKKIIKENGKTQ